jgi:drug/metabolite transporter (DMT)-like permease
MDVRIWAVAAVSGVFGVAAGHLVGERLAGRQWLGAVVVVAATAAIAWRQHRAAPAADRGRIECRARYVS